MIYNPEHNDVVMNFYRAKVYRFDKNNVQHYKDASRCRYATFEERERFIKLNKEIAHINEVLDLTVRNRSKWDKKAVPDIVLKINDRTLSDFIKFANKIGIYDYETLIGILFQLFEQKGVPENCDKLKKENKRLREKIRKMKLFFDEI